MNVTGGVTLEAMMSRGEQIGMRIFMFLFGAGLCTEGVLVATNVIDTNPVGLGWRIFFTIFCGLFGLHIIGVAIFSDFSKPPTPGPRAVGLHIGSGGVRFGVLDDVADDIDGADGD